MTIIYSGGRPVALDQKMYAWSGDMSETYGSAINYHQWLEDTSDTLDTHPDTIWRTQPWVRTVVDFIATNVGQVPIHSYTADADDNRDRVRDSPLARLLTNPDPGRATGYTFRHSLVIDRAMWDRYCAVITNTTGRDDGWRVTRIPPRHWSFLRDSTDAPEAVKLTDGRTVGLDRMLWLDAYPSAARSPIDTLRDTLLEEHRSAKARRDLWAKRAIMPGYLTRPADAPDWVDAARDNFRRSWQAYASGGTRAGATPILEDGMSYHPANVMTSVDAQQLEARTLSRREVMAFFHVASQLVGDSAATNYSNVNAYLEALHVVTLGRWYVELQEAINARLVPHVAADGDEYAEFAVGAALRGSIEAQTDNYYKALGTPWRTINEVRKEQNLHPVDNGNEVIVPISVRPAD